MSTKLDLDALRGHTAGDWVAVSHAQEIPVIETLDGKSVAYTQQQAHGPADIARRHADARLIAAAPQLLSELLAYRARDAAVAELVAALEKIAAIEDQMYGDDWQEIELARRYANEALAAFRQGAARED